jgi:hypothetical protein
VAAYTYHPHVLEALARHGLVPRPTTTPGQLRDAVRELYKYEIRRLRDERLAGRIPKGEYAAHVVRLRERYPLLSLPVERWVVSPFPSSPPSTTITVMADFEKLGLFYLGR